MKGRSLQLPAALAVAIVAVPAAIALATTSCGGDDASQKDAMEGCAVYCVMLDDAGTPPPDGCPLCADFSTGSAVCPEACQPLG
jgi:hypothetical protein